MSDPYEVILRALRQGPLRLYLQPGCGDSWYEKQERDKAAEIYKALRAAGFLEPAPRGEEGSQETKK